MKSHRQNPNRGRNLPPPLINLKVLLLFQLFAEQTSVTNIVAETPDGAFGLLLDRIEADFKQQVDCMRVMHRVSNLPPDLLKEVESIIVTQTTDPCEAQALATMYSRAGEEAEWETLLNGLTIKEAALLPRMDAPERRLQKFNVAGRITPHVRRPGRKLPEELRPENVGRLAEALAEDARGVEFERLVPRTNTGPIHPGNQVNTKPVGCIHVGRCWANVNATLVKQNSTGK